MLFRSVKNEPEDPAEKSKKKKSSTEKRKTTAVLVAEPDAKQPRAVSPAASTKKKDDRPFCIYHNRHAHATEDCYELKRLRDSREARERGRGGRGGRGKGRWNNNYQQNPQANAAQQQPAAQDDNLPDEAPGGYQVPHAVACILGGALAPASNRHFKQIAREICAALPGVEASRPLKWSQCPITFDSGDHPRSTSTVGTIPLEIGRAHV